jgi:predicted  nucleic acid-binding Zn-ribbon protein
MKLIKSFNKEIKGSEPGCPECGENIFYYSESGSAQRYYRAKLNNGVLDVNENSVSIETDNFDEAQVSCHNCGEAFGDYDAVDFV